MCGGRGRGCGSGVAAADDDGWPSSGTGQQVRLLARRGSCVVLVSCDGTSRGSRRPDSLTAARLFRVPLRGPATAAASPS